MEVGVASRSEPEQVLHLNSLQSKCIYICLASHIKWTDRYCTHIIKACHISSGHSSHTIGDQPFDG